MKNKRILFSASYSVIEPLGLLHLAGLARDMGWERDFSLVKYHDFEPFFEKVRDFKPRIVGFNVYTGNHLQLHEAFKKLRKDHPNIATVVGGPHATYFPSETLKFADFVVMSEGFEPLKSILNGEARPGILPLSSGTRFPQSDRVNFYTHYPDHGKSRIKSVITMTGCPYACTYCYNSTKLENISSNMPPEIADGMVKKLGSNGRLFPKNVRTVDDVVAEGTEIARLWPDTKVIYFQDDVHGFDINDWMPEFAERWKKEVGIPYHAQMRWEMTRQERRLDLLQRAGCFGLTLAIEAADPVIRTEVLDRRMPTEIMFEGMKDIASRGLKVRTEQITGLPYGATSKPTSINLDADLELVKLNVELLAKSGGPTMAWASTLAPYKGTNMGNYCEKYGFYNGDNSDVPDTFFEKSVLRFPKKWIGPDLERVKNEPGIWLEGSELERYRNQNRELRNIFNFVTLVPEGHELARKYFESEKPFSYDRLGIETIDHLRSLSNNGSAGRILSQIGEIRAQIDSMGIKDAALVKDLEALVPYFACIPGGKLAVERAVKYAHAIRNGGNSQGISQTALSTAIRHHLYDNVLYATDNLHLPENLRNPSKI